MRDLRHYNNFVNLYDFNFSYINSVTKIVGFVLLFKSKISKILMIYCFIIFFKFHFNLIIMIMKVVVLYCFLN